MKQARINWNGARNGNERKAYLRAGAKGKGRVIQVVVYWPDSYRSVEGAERIFAEVAEREGYQIIGEWDEE